MKALRVINLGGCNLVTNATLSAIAANCPDLVALDLTCCLKITDDGLHSLSQGCLQIESLNLWGCSNVTSSGKVWKPQFQVTDAGMKSLHMMKLQSLNLFVVGFELILYF
jgi:EIN3-binding F-box protein